MKKLIEKMAYSLGIKYLLSRVRDAAEGRLGPVWKERYWRAVGLKTRTGLLLACVAAGLEALGQREAAAVLGSVAAIAIQAGVLDKAWRNDLPKFLWESTLYRYLVRLAPITAVVFGVFAVAIQDGYCFSLNCDVLAKVVLGVAAVAVQLGILDAAWQAKAPVMIFEDEPLDYEKWPQ